MSKQFHGFTDRIQRTKKDENDRKTSAYSDLGSDLHCGQGTTNISTKYWMAWPRCVCNRFQILGAFACARSDFPSFPGFPSLKHLCSSCHTPIDKDSVSSWIWTYLNWGHERRPQLDTGVLQSINKSLRRTNLPTCGKPPHVLSHQRRRWFEPCVKMAGNYQELPSPVAPLTIWFHDPLLGWLTSYRRPKLRHPMRSSYISKQRKRWKYLRICSMSQLSQGTFRSFSTSTLNIHILLRGPGSGFELRGCAEKSYLYTIILPVVPHKAVAEVSE